MLLQKHLIQLFRVNYSCNQIKLAGDFNIGFVKTNKNNEITVQTPIDILNNAIGKKSVTEELKGLCLVNAYHPDQINKTRTEGSQSQKIDIADIQAKDGILTFKLTDISAEFSINEKTKMYYQSLKNNTKTRLFAQNGDNQTPFDHSELFDQDDTILHITQNWIGRTDPKIYAKHFNLNDQGLDQIRADFKALNSNIRSLDLFKNLDVSNKDNIAQFYNKIVAMDDFQKFLNNINKDELQKGFEKNNDNQYEIKQTFLDTLVKGAKSADKAINGLLAGGSFGREKGEYTMIWPLSDGFSGNPNHQNLADIYLEQALYLGKKIEEYKNDNSDYRWKKIQIHLIEGENAKAYKHALETTINQNLSVNKENIQKYANAYEFLQEHEISLENVTDRNNRHFIMELAAYAYNRNQKNERYLNGITCLPFLRGYAKDQKIKASIQAIKGLVNNDFNEFWQSH